MNEATYRISLAFISQSSRAKMRTTERRSSDDDRHSRWFMLSLYPSLADRIILMTAKLTSQRDTTRQSWLRNRQLPSESPPTKNAQDNGKKLFLLLFLNPLFLFFLFLKRNVWFTRHNICSFTPAAIHTQQTWRNHSFARINIIRDKRARHYKKKREKRTIITTQCR